MKANASTPLRGVRRHVAAARCDRVSLPGAPRARTPSMGVAVPAACCVCGSPLRSSARARGAARAYRCRDRKPAPLSVERRPRRRDPATAAGPVPLGVALMSILSVGDASTGRAASKDTGIAPHQRRQRDLEHRLVIPGEGGHLPKPRCSGAAAPVPLRTSCARSEATHLFWAGRLRLAGDCNLARGTPPWLAAGARPPGSARRTFLSGVGGRAGDARTRHATALETCGRGCVPGA